MLQWGDTVFERACSVQNETKRRLDKQAYNTLLREGNNDLMIWTSNPNPIPFTHHWMVNVTIE